MAGGADAVYFGLSNFNARHRASNFTVEELPQVIDYLHRRNVLGYVDVNTLIFSDELAEAAELIAAIVAAGADAVIVQDLGLVRLVHRLAPELPIHGSTQMTLTEPRGIEFVRRLGVERVILARELSLDDIRLIATRTDMPLEVFVHGALCIAYSGQCLTSEALGGRSANRGQCAQACRLPYELIVDGQPARVGRQSLSAQPAGFGRVRFDRVAGEAWRAVLQDRRAAEDAAVCGGRLRKPIAQPSMPRRPASRSSCRGSNCLIWSKVFRAGSVLDSSKE